MYAKYLIYMNNLENVQVVAPAKQLDIQILEIDLPFFMCREIN